MIITIVIISIIIILATVYHIFLRRKIYGKLNYMVDALEDNETNFKFTEDSIFNRRLNKTLNRIRGIFDTERSLMAEQEAYFKNMLDHVGTGILAMRKDGKIEFMNSQAGKLMQAGVLSNVKQLKNTNVSLYNGLVSVRNGQNIKVEYYNESTKRQLLLSASYATLKGENLKIIALNDISVQLSENEDESWSRLTRVLTHEIMNTITPISSLSNTLLSCDEGLDDNVRTGLQTISASSQNLIKFVNSYRNLTRIPAPNKRTFILKDLVEKVFRLTAELAEIETEYIENSEDIILYGDEGQISQILINLVKNAIQAGAAKVTVTAGIDMSESVVVNVENNGTPITKKDTAELFVPFYTTKSDGTGIGLSISRQIMRMHNGTLDLTRSDQSGTVFTLKFA